MGSGCRNSVLSSVAYEGMGETGTLVCGYKRGGLDQRVQRESRVGGHLKRVMSLPHRWGEARVVTPHQRVPHRLRKLPRSPDCDREAKWLLARQLWGPATDKGCIGPTLGLHM